MIVWHSVAVCYGGVIQAEFFGGPLRPLLYSIVPAFFALSGFLVASSLERNKIPQFVTLRIMRIFPALVVEVFISALVIGPLLTTFTWRMYFSDHQFFTYFLNVIGYIHYRLPGVFINLPASGYVNLQLWTVPLELDCYLILTALVIIGVAKRKIWLSTIALVGALVPTLLTYFGFQAIPRLMRGLLAKWSYRRFYLEYHCMLCAEVSSLNGYCFSFRS